MNQKQIDELKKTLPPWQEYKTWTAEQKQLEEELFCREMIISCLTYGEHFLHSRYKDGYIKSLGEKRVLELYDEQFEYFKNCKVLCNVYTDGEGVTYNSVIEP